MRRAEHEITIMLCSTFFDSGNFGGMRDETREEKGEHETERRGMAQ
jgi:hypothetical protein